MRPLRLIALGTLFLAACGWQVFAQFQSSSVVSHSRQFYIHGRPAGFASPIAPGAELPDVFTLSPELLAITCDRVKAAVLGLLQLQDTYQSRIHVTIFPRQHADQPVRLVTTLYRDGWDFQLGLPEEIAERQLLESLVQVVLMDISQRGASRQPEMPPWLVPGITQNLIFSMGASLIVRPSPLGWQARLPDLLSWSRDVLRAARPPSYTDLSFPGPMVPHSPAMTNFHAASHLFVHGLLKLRDGPRNLAAFLQTLPQTLNWQTAFLTAYRSHFQTALDVEKWWALQVADVTSRDRAQSWSLGDSLGKLDAQLTTALEYRATTNSLAEQKSLSLVQLLRTVDFPLQQQVIAAKSRQLLSIQPFLAKPVEILAIKYRIELESYADARSRMAYEAGLPSTLGTRIEKLVKATLRDLEQLDDEGRKLAQQVRR